MKEIVTKKTAKVAITRKNLEKYAGVKKFRFGETEAEDMVGVVTGLAWTEVGGEILTIESVMLPGKGNVKQTGKLGDVMQESVSAALSYVRSRSIRFGIKPTLFEKRDIHVHVPEGATPKDGPSAGIAMATSIVSVLTGIPVRRDVAMTGEITLRGRVLPIGGLKEKLLAALRAGHHHRVHPEGEREGSGGNPGQREEEPEAHSGGGRGRGDRPGAGAPAGGDRVGGAAGPPVPPPPKPQPARPRCRTDQASRRAVCLNDHGTRLGHLERLAVARRAVFLEFLVCPPLTRRKPRQ